MLMTEWAAVQYLCTAGPSPMLPFKSLHKFWKGYFYSHLGNYKINTCRATVEPSGEDPCQFPTLWFAVLWVSRFLSRFFWNVLEPAPWQAGGAPRSCTRSYYSPWDSLYLPSSTSYTEFSSRLWVWGLILTFKYHLCIDKDFPWPNFTEPSLSPCH